MNRAGIIIAAVLLSTLTAIRAASPLEGTWQWSSGATVDIRTDDNGTLILTLTDSPDPAITTPQPLGYATPGGTPDVSRATIHTTPYVKTGGFTDKTIQVKLRLSADGHLGIEPYDTGLRVNMWRIVPWLFRFSVSRNKEPEGLEGAVRIHPRTGTAANPLVL